jgi:hypothetical protein
VNVYKYTLENTEGSIKKNGQSKETGKHMVHNTKKNKTKTQAQPRNDKIKKTKNNNTATDGN